MTHVLPLTSQTGLASHVALVAMLVHAGRHEPDLVSHRHCGSDAQPILLVWRSSHVLVQPLPPLLNWHRPVATQAASVLKALHDGAHDWRAVSHWQFDCARQ